MKPSPWKQNEAATSSAEDISLFDFFGVYDSFRVCDNSVEGQGSMSSVTFHLETIFQVT
jgi:hypothetical protein